VGIELIIAGLVPLLTSAARVIELNQRGEPLTEQERQEQHRRVAAFMAAVAAHADELRAADKAAAEKSD
jgi:hypothetical protein